MKFKEYLLYEERLFEDKMYVAAQSALKKLSPKAKDAIGEWTTRNWIGGKLEKHYLAKDEIFKEIQKVFDEEFESIIPETITLYRGVNDIVLSDPSTKALIDSKSLESWTDDIRVAEWFAFLRETPRLKHEDIQKEKMKKYDNIDDVTNRFNKNGYVVFDNKLFIINKANTKYFDIWSLDKNKTKNNRWLGDGYTASFKESILMDKDMETEIFNSIHKKRGKIITKTFKRSDILWYIKNPWNSSIEYIIKIK